MENMHDQCRYCLDYALGELHDELCRKRFERHLPTCFTCQADLIEYRQILRDLQRPPSEANAPVDQMRNTNLCNFQKKDHSPRFPGRATIWVSRRFAMVSVPATAVILTIAALLHIHHFVHFEAIGDSAWAHISHSVRNGGWHLRNDIHRI
ncbi:hypothetical protein [Alicyclobacillus suci]|uniref:hypothetical protein n=1 Tax=Alicyclobacillus suci TaxID=2816080 RepID=UPI0011BE8126|nr:hypothetical protein [Alicyclobacillus suci]